MVTASAPSNIAVVKYWGKRDQRLNLPMTDSLSVSLPETHGTTTYLAFCEQQDRFSLNGKPLAVDSQFAVRLTRYLDRFRPQGVFFKVDTHNTIATAAGLASSASGFAALAKALNRLLDWNLSEQDLSVVARLGSGSACRSLWPGFVKWQQGEREDGEDSFAQPLPHTWPGLCLGIIEVDASQKAISSREAMQRTIETSALYQQRWCTQVAEDMQRVERAIVEQDFDLLGRTSENNALLMHATMADASPSVSYTTEQTIAVREQVWQCRAEGVPVYFTQDAGPNIKVLYLPSSENVVKRCWPAIQTLSLFGRCIPGRLTV